MPQTLAVLMLILGMCVVKAEATPIGLLNLSTVVNLSSSGVSPPEEDPNFFLIAPTTLTFVDGSGKTVSISDFASDDGLIEGTMQAFDPGVENSTKAVFIQFSKTSDFLLVLNDVLPGIFSSAQCGAIAAPGQVCTPDGTVYNFINTQTGSTLSISFDGVAMDGARSVAPFTGILNAQFDDLNFQTLFKQMQLGASFQTSATGSIAVGLALGDESPIPEPSPAVLVSGCLLTGLLLSGRVRNSLR